MIGNVGSYGATRCFLLVLLLSVACQADPRGEPTAVPGTNGVGHRTESAAANPATSTPAVEQESPDLEIPDLAAGEDYPNAGRLTEEALRRHAIHKPMPEYPAASLQAGVGGSVVGYVLVDTEGNLIRAHVLEAPDDHLAASVKQALANWTWRPFTFDDTGERFRAEGRISFYFDPSNGGRVLETRPEGA